ncbi:hypothetical protein CCS41_13975 (plasmid) [Candidatus Fukatsuia symbiotica]|uniref:Transposase IS801/IS1294 domain-containing protein n=1 Tax=Candidatus Fukatsuia symbiotica TaxID=1878942 RepID=A0A2U8I8P2_9GAMM|nr:hypothetical protein CCS41_13975 [Candidatus Fukatsuia symbiotica]
MGEFIRCFISHILDKNFIMIRYYGFFAPHRRTKLLMIYTLLK